MKLRVLSSAAEAAITLEFEKYPDKRSVLLHALRVAQQETGYLSEEAMRDVATLLELTPVQVYDVATFYTLFHLQPVGKHVIYACKSLPCALVGASALCRHIQNRLGVGIGETTSDNQFTLKQTECLASCGSGPMVQINDNYYEYLTPAKVDRLLDDLRARGKSDLASKPFKIPNVTGA